MTHYCDLCSLCTLGQYWDQFSIEFILQCAHFTVTGGNEAGVDLVLIQPCLLYYVNHVVLMLTSIFISKIYIRKGNRFVSKQGEPQPHLHSEARTLRMAYSVSEFLATSINTVNNAAKYYKTTR